jgi:hypothetical protein
VIGLAFSLIFLPFKILLVMFRIFAELLEHAGHRRHHGGRRHHRSRRHVARRALTSGKLARHRGRRRRVWQVVGVLFIIGFIGAYPAVSATLVLLALIGFLVHRQSSIRRQQAEQQRRSADLAADQVQREALAALHPEDINWLREAGWRAPSETRSNPLAG